MIFELDDKQVEDGTILVFGIRYPGSNSRRIYTYAAMKAGGRWYFTGTGKTPQDAAWSAVQRWLADMGREVAWVKAVVLKDMETIWAWSRPGARGGRDHPIETFEDRADTIDHARLGSRPR